MNSLKKYSFLLLLTLTALAMGSFGCASDSGNEASGVSTVAQALTPVTVVEFVNPGSTMSCTGTGATLYEDPANPTPLLTATTVIKNTTLTSFYNTSTDTATAFLTAAQWATDCAIVNTPGRKTKISITYNNEGTDSKKTLTQPPTFSLL